VPNDEQLLDIFEHKK